MDMQQSLYCEKTIPSKCINLFLVEDMWPKIEVLGQQIQLKISLSILKEKTVVT